MSREVILDAIARLESGNGNGNSRNGESSRNSLLSRCRSIESRAPDVMFGASEVREILGLVLEQVRWSAEEQNNLQSDNGGADNEDEDMQDEELTIEEAPGPPEKSLSRSRYYQTQLELIGVRNSRVRFSH